MNQQNNSNSASLKVNEYLIRISASAIPVSQPLNIDDDISVVIDGSITKSEDRSNQDGSVNRIYTLKGVSAVVINKENGEILAEEEI